MAGPGGAAHTEQIKGAISVLGGREQEAGNFITTQNRAWPWPGLSDGLQLTSGA